MTTILSVAVLAAFVFALMWAILDDLGPNGMLFVLVATALVLAALVHLSYILAA